VTKAVETEKEARQTVLDAELTAKEASKAVSALSGRDQLRKFQQEKAEAMDPAFEKTVKPVINSAFSRAGKDTLASAKDRGYDKTVKNNFEGSQAEALYRGLQPQPQYSINNESAGIAPPNSTNASGYYDPATPPVSFHNAAANYFFNVYERNIRTRSPGWSNIDKYEKALDKSGIESYRNNLTDIDDYYSPDEINDMAADTDVIIDATDSFKTISDFREEKKESRSAVTGNVRLFSAADNAQDADDDTIEDYGNVRKDDTDIKTVPDRGSGRNTVQNDRPDINLVANTSFGRDFVQNGGPDKKMIRNHNNESGNIPARGDGTRADQDQLTDNILADVEKEESGFNSFRPLDPAEVVDQQTLDPKVSRVIGEIASEKEAFDELSDVRSIARYAQNAEKQQNMKKSVRTAAEDKKSSAEKSFKAIQVGAVLPQNKGTADTKKASAGSISLSGTQAGKLSSLHRDSSVVNALKATVVSPESKEDKSFYKGTVITPKEIMNETDLDSDSAVGYEKDRMRSRSSGIPVQAAHSMQQNTIQPSEQQYRQSNMILDMHEQGKSNVAIARELGLGVGEVGLVIELAQKNRRKRQSRL
jgi:hypothetical protein